MDITQTLFQIPAEITDTFRSAGETLNKIRSFDYMGAWIFTLGLLIILVVVVVSIQEEARGETMRLAESALKSRRS